MEGSPINNSVYIVSADAKDLFLSNYSNDHSKEYTVRYGSGDNRGEVNTKRFVNTLDYSLDLIKMREVYEKIYRRMDFTFSKRGKEYCTRVINVTFKYSVKEFNRFFDKTYIKYGYLPCDVNLVDNVCIKDGELIAVRVDSPVDHPVDSAALGKLFVFEDGVYKLGKSMKVIFTASQLRSRLYRNGFVCDGVRFCRFKRSAGSGRVGKCLFIDERLYPRMHKWEQCGLHIREGQEVDLAGFEAYIALTLSSIIGTISLRPENFLVIDDYISKFTDRVVATRVGDDGWLSSRPEDVEIENSIWDGQSLIDKSAMGEYDKHGMILLRNRFFKSACFNCNIQDFFAEHGITEVSQLKGFTLAESISDIKIITTPSSIKYVKFGPLETWLKLLEDDGDFGVVKYEKPTDFFDGRMVQIKTSVNKIGEIVNLSQELNTKLWDALNGGADFSEVEELYCEIAQLDVLSNIEIDKAKREYAVDSVAEIKRLRKKYEARDDDGRQIKPNFLGKIARMKGYYDSDRKNYKFHHTTMDYLQHSLNTFRVNYVRRDYMPFSALLAPKDGCFACSVKYSQVERILEFVRDMRSKIQMIWNGTDDDLDNYSKAILVNEVRQEYLSYIERIKLNRHTAYRLLLAIEDPANKEISRTLFYALFSLPNQDFLNLIEQSRVPIPLLVEDENIAGSIEIYNFRFRKEMAIPANLADCIH